MTLDVDRLIELKSCPFCGGVAAMKRTELDERQSYGRMAEVCCGQCGARTAPFFHNDGRGYAIKETADPKAIAAWNTRAMSASEQKDASL